MMTVLLEYIDVGLIYELQILLLLFVGVRWIYVRIIVPGMVTHSITIVNWFTMFSHACIQNQY